MESWRERWRKSKNSEKNGEMKDGEIMMEIMENGETERDEEMEG